jgi:hypothetical protein
MRIVIKDTEGNYLKSTVVTYQSDLKVGCKPGYEEDDGYFTVFCEEEDISTEHGCWNSRRRASEILEWIIERLESGQNQIDITMQ